MSGVIYAVIVAMWAAFLVPMWLRRHDERVAESRPTGGFSTAMRILARRATASAALDGPTRLTERASGEAALVSKRRSATTTVATASEAIGVRITDYEQYDEETQVIPRARLRSLAASPSGLDHQGRTAVIAERAGRAGHAVRPRASLAVRRRRVLLALGTATIVLAVVAQVLSRSIILPVVPAALTVAYLAHLRVQARRAAEIARARRSDASRSASVRPADGLSEAIALARSRNAAAELVDRVPPVMVEPARQSPEAFAATYIAPVAHVTPPPTAAPIPNPNPNPPAVPDDFAGPRVAWEPVRVPTPTYVNAARAPRPVRKIDLAAPGAWTSGRLVSDAAAAAARAVGESRPHTTDDASDEDAQEHRAAVGD